MENSTSDNIHYLFYKQSPKSKKVEAVVTVRIEEKTEPDSSYKIWAAYRWLDKYSIGQECSLVAYFDHLDNLQDFETWECQDDWDQIENEDDFMMLQTVWDYMYENLINVNDNGIITIQPSVNIPAQTIMTNDFPLDRLQEIVDYWPLNLNFF
jgi:hypothetical protein